MFPAIYTLFSNSKKKMKLANFLLSSGISVKGDKFFVNGVNVSMSSLASKLGVDRKTIYAFTRDVRRNFVLRSIFSGLSAVGDPSKVAPDIGYEVVKFEASPDRAIEFLDKLSGLASIVSFSYVNGNFYVIYDRPIPHDKLNELVSGIGNVKIFTPDTRKKGLICERCEIEFCPRKKVRVR